MAAQRSKLKSTSTSTSHPSFQNTSLIPSTETDLTSEYQSSFSSPSSSPSSSSETAPSTAYRTRSFPSQVGEDWESVEKREGEDEWDLLSEMNRVVKVPSTETEEEKEKEKEKEEKEDVG